MPVTEIGGAADLAAALKANKSKLVVVDFFATWCGPCKAIAPHVDTLSSRYAKEATFLKLDVDKAPDVAKEAGVQAMPSFGFYGDGKMVELMKGADPRGLEERVKKYSAQFFKSPFTSAGYSLAGSRPASAASAAAAAAPAASAAASGGAAAGSSQPLRKNPWADPSFFPGKKSTSSTAAATAAAAASTSSTHSTIPAGSRLLNGAASSSSTSTPSAAAATSSAPPAADTSASSAPSTSASTAAAPATSPAPAKAASSHPALQVKPELLQQLRDMGFTDLRAQKALLFTGNKDAEDALNWLVEHQDDADIDEPLQVLGVERKEKESGGLPAGVNIDELDEDARVLYADLLQRKAKEQSAGASTAAASSAAATTGSAAGSGKKTVSEMTSEEKRQWLDERRTAVKARKEAEALEKVKSDYKSSKGMTHAMNELKEQKEEFERQQAIARKKKEEADKAKQRRDIQERLAADKERRRLEQEKTMAALQKAREEKANGGK